MSALKSQKCGERIQG